MVSASVAQWHVIALCGTGIDLTRTADRLLVGDHLFPLCDPTGKTAHGEHHCEHLCGDADGAVNDAACRSQTFGLERAAHKVVVIQRHFLQLLREIEDRVVDAEFVQHVIARFLDDGGTRIEVLVNTVSEAHDAERIVLVPWPYLSISAYRHRLSGCSPASRSQPD
jgi:hypothetical protein